MDALTYQQFRLLILHEDEHCLSIYMPAHRAGKEVKQDAVRLTNLIKKAERIFSAASNYSFEGFVSPITEMMENQAMRNQRCDGLAIFKSEKQLKNDHLTSSQLKDIVPLSVEGKIGILFTDLSKYHWGRFNIKSYQVAIHNRF